MKIKFKNYFLLILLTVFCVSGFLSLTFITKKANAQSISEEVESENNYICYDIKDGATGTCCSDEDIDPLSLDGKYSCLDYGKTHGPGRENGGTGLLDSGCRNYMGNGYTYGTTDIPYWINMESINEIDNSAHREKILADIREQTEMWNQAIMYDGTGQIVNIYEVTSSNKPSNIDGRKVIEVLQNDLSEITAGRFYHSTCTIELNYDNTYKMIGYNVDTIVHEFGHVLGLRDIDSATGVSYGTHKTLMGYSRGTTAEGLKSAIKYQDIQGIAVMTGRHICNDSHFIRYVKVGSEYRHICFYCDRIDNRTSIISGSKPIGADCGVNNHDYQLMVSCGKRGWIKCTKCYKVIGTTAEISPFTTTISGNTCRITGLKPGITLSGSLTIPEDIDGKNVTWIESSAFSNCTELTSVTIPASVTSIGSYAFEYCTNIKSVTFESGSKLTVIGNKAFYGCSSLERIDIPASVMSIGEQAFYGCSSLEKAIIYNQTNVIILGSGAFAGTADDLKIYVLEELYSDYITARDWIEYASVLDKFNMYGNIPYILESVTYPGDVNYTFLWVYYFNSYVIDGPTENGVIGLENYTYWYIRMDAMPGFLDIQPPYQEEYYMWIWLGEYANGLEFDIYNFQKQYTMSVTVENGILCVPLEYFIESWVFCRFYILPGEENNTVVEFNLSDIDIILIVASYL